MRDAQPLPPTASRAMALLLLLCVSTVGSTHSSPGGTQSQLQPAGATAIPGTVVLAQFGEQNQLLQSSSVAVRSFEVPALALEQNIEQQAQHLARDEQRLAAFRHKADDDQHRLSKLEQKAAEAEAAVARQRRNVADSQNQAEKQLTAIAEEKQHIRELRSQQKEHREAMRKLAKQVACMGRKTCPSNQRCVVCEPNDPLCLPGRHFRCEDPCKSFIKECKSNEACIVKNHKPLCKDACKLAPPKASCQSRQRPICVGVNHRPACFSVCAQGGGDAVCQKHLPGSECVPVKQSKKRQKPYFCFDPCNKCVKKPLNGCDLKTMKCIDPCKALGELPPNKAFHRWGFGRYGGCRIEDLCAKGNRCEKNAWRAKKLGLKCSFQSKNKLCQTACIPKVDKDGALASECVNPCGGGSSGGNGGTGNTVCGGNATLSCTVDLRNPSLPRTICVPACDEKNYPCPDPKNPKGSGNLCKPDGRHGHQCISACSDPSYNPDKGDKLCKDLFHPRSIYVQRERRRGKFIGSKPPRHRRKHQRKSSAHPATGKAPSKKHKANTSTHTTRGASKKKTSSANNNKAKSKKNTGKKSTGKKAKKKQQKKQKQKQNGKSPNVSKSSKKTVKVSAGPVCKSVPGRPLIQLCDLCSRSTCPGANDPKDHTQCKIVIRLNKKTRMAAHVAKCVNPCKAKHNPCAFPYFGSPTDSFACTPQPADEKGKTYHCKTDLCRNLGGKKKCSENKYKVLCIRDSKDSQQSKCVNPCGVILAGQKACPVGTKCTPDHWGAQLTDPKYFKCKKTSTTKKKKKATTTKRQVSSATSKKQKKPPSKKHARRKSNRKGKRQSKKKKRHVTTPTSSTNFTSVRHVLNSPRAHQL